MSLIIVRGIASCVAIAFAISSCDREPPCPACEVTDADPGELVWEQAFTASNEDSARAIAIDAASGRVAVGGAIVRMQGTRDLWVGVLSHGGAPQWDATLHQRSDDSAQALTFDPRGELWVAGSTDLGPSVGSDSSAGWLVGFTRGGAQAESFELADDEEPERTRVRFQAVVESDGRVFVGGNRTHFYRSSAVAAAYDREGALLWSYVRDDAGGSSDVAALHAFSNGNLLLVGGRSPSGGTRALSLVELSRDGELVAERVSEDIAPRSVVVAQRPEGTVLLLRTTTGIAVVSLSGEVLREATFGEEEDPNAFAAGLDGDVFVVGSRLLASGEVAPWVARYDESLGRQWEQVVARRGELTAAAVGPNGDVFVTGRVVAPPVGKVSDFTNIDIWIGRFAR